MTLKAILFDFDDTLIDWRRRTQDWQAYNREHTGYVFQYLRQQGHVLEDEAAFYDATWERTLQAWNDARRTLRAPHIGDVLLDTCQQFGLPREKLVKADLVDAFRWEPFPGVEPFDDVLEVLPDLHQRGIALGLVTNAFQPMRMRNLELEAYGLSDYLHGECRISAADVGYLKPHPLIFRAALEKLNLDADQVVFVGDSREADIMGAKNIGMRTVLRLNEDNHTSNGLPIMPDATVTTFHELYPLLDEWFPEWRD